MSKWKPEKHFTSWLGLSPNNKITDGKVFHTKTRKINNKTSNAFRMAALNLARGAKLCKGIKCAIGFCNKW